MIPGDTNRIVGGPPDTFIGRQAGDRAACRVAAILWQDVEPVYTLALILLVCRLPMILVVVASLLGGCDVAPAGSTAEGEPSSAAAPAPPGRAAVAPAVSADEPPSPPGGDLGALQERGSLRILIPANVGGVFYLPRAGWPVVAQHELAEAFARSEGLEPELVPITRFSDLIPALLDGHGDIIAANLTVTEQRRRTIGFSVPLTTVRQQVLVAEAEDGISSAADLSGRRVMVMGGSSFQESLQALRQRWPGIEIVQRPEGLSDEQALDLVAGGEVDATLRDSNIAEMYLAYRDDLKVAFRLPQTDDIAWGLRPGATALKAALNRFLHLELPDDVANSTHTDDWPGIERRRTLRVMLRNNAASYFLHRGELHGFEYELAKSFADAHELRLEVIVPSDHQSMLDGLAAGHADVAAGFLEPDETLGDRGIAFSRPYHHAARHVVVRSEDVMDGVADLQDRTITVRRSSPYWQDLVDLQRQGVRLHIDIAPEDVETEQLIARVARGAIGATVADGHLLGIELARGVPVHSAVQLSDERPHAVAVRSDNPQLLARLNAFIRQEYRGLVYNILRKKYFTNAHQVRVLAGGRAGGEQGLSPYDDIIRRYADRYGFDWRLITAQMFQESRFDPTAKSFAGALGLMQVMPRTAKFMGFGDIDDVDEGIHAGVKYLDWVRNRFESDLPFDDRLWFSLAAYNAGHGHVEDARRLARQKGWDGDRWFDHVEKAMLLLSRKKYADKARHGYVRGSEPVSYVRDIRERYRAYVAMASDLVADSHSGDAGRVPDTL